MTDRTAAIDGEARRRRSLGEGPSAVLRLSALLLLIAGCGGQNVDTTYGRNRNPSVNGTGAFAALVRGEGHEVKTAVRLTDELKEWADVIVRFAPRSGPPPRDEAVWYAEWLDETPGRRLVYVPYDYNATPEYWTRVLEGLPRNASARLRERVVEARAEADGWKSYTPPGHAAKEVADAGTWFAVEKGTEQTCKALSGPWAEGVDPARASLTRRQTLKADGSYVFLEGDGKPLVVSRTRANDSEILIIANGSFLLNLPLVEPGRWPLARRAVGWLGGEGGGVTEPKSVAFVEGPFVLAGRAAAPSVFALLNVPPFGLVAAQMLALGLAGCLARAPRLGRPRPAEPSGADRPAAHPEALGALLARTRQALAARATLDAYRRWRHVGQSAKGEQRPKAGQETQLNH